jgi:hypothetical protein
MLELRFCKREFEAWAVESILLINLSDCFVVFPVESYVTFSLIITGNVVCVREFCKVGDIFTGQRGKVGVGKLMSHGGIVVGALSWLSFSVCIISDNMVGLVFVITGDVVVLLESCGLCDKCVLSDCMIDVAIKTGLDCCVT